jgi:antitoxin component of RelBE/YafQ-DinJ toxin-antitoxin module
MARRDRTFVQVQVDPNKKNRFAQKLEQEGKTITDVINVWIDQYLGESSPSVDVAELRNNVIELQQRLSVLEQALEVKERDYQGEFAA